MRLLLLSAIRLPCGWSESFDHFMMDVIQARGFAIFEERYGISKVLDGERCQDGFTAVGFSAAFLLRILPFFVRLLVEQELVGNRVRCNVRRADWLSVVSIVIDL